VFDEMARRFPCRRVRGTGVRRRELSPYIGHVLVGARPEETSARAPSATAEGLRRSPLDHRERLARSGRRPPRPVFYNPGTSTYFWVVANRKSEARRGKVRLVELASAA
jgi:hypothetical protein